MMMLVTPVYTGCTFPGTAVAVAAAAGVGSFAATTGAGGVGRRSGGNSCRVITFRSPAAGGVATFSPELARPR